MFKKVMLKKMFILLFLVLFNLKALSNLKAGVVYNEENLSPIYKDVVDMIVTLHWRFVKEGCFPIDFSLSTVHVRDYLSFSAKVDPQKCNNFLKRASTDYNFNIKKGVGYIQIDNCIIAYFPEERGTITRTVKKPIWVGCDYSDVFIIYKASLPPLTLEFMHDIIRDEKKDYYETVLKNPSIYINKLKNSFYGSLVLGEACGIATKSACIKAVKNPGVKDVKELIESTPDLFFKIDPTKGVYEIRTAGTDLSPFLKGIKQLFPSEAHFFSYDVTSEWLEKYYKYKKQPFFSFLSSFLNNSTEQQEYMAWVKQQIAMAKPDLEKKEEFEKKEIKEKASDSETTVDPFFKELIKEFALLQASLIAHECLTLNIDDSDRERISKLGRCKGFLEAKGEGSFNPLTKSGTVKIGNYKITYQWGKPVRFECDLGYYLTLIPLQDLPILIGYESEQSFSVYIDLRQRLLDYKFAAHISVGKAEAQFILSKEGIEQIHNLSSIFDIRQMFTSIGGNITINELVLWLMKYYDYKKKQEKGNIHSINFLVSFLTNVLEQEKFVMWIAEQKKQSYHQQDLKQDQDQDQDKVKTNSQIKKDEKEQKQQTTKKRGVRR